MDDPFRLSDTCTAFPVSQPPESPAPLSATNEGAARLLAEELKGHETVLRNYLRYRFPTVDADDVVQESYLRLFRIQSFGRIASAKAYFFSIARNTALRLFRRREQLYARTPLTQLSHLELLDGGLDGAEIAESRDRLELVAEAVEQLPRRCGEIIGLAILKGLSAAEIAKELRLSENTVRVQLARGIKKCAHYLRERDSVP